MGNVPSEVALWCALRIAPLKRDVLMSTFWMWVVGQHLPREVYVDKAICSGELETKKV